MTRTPGERDDFTIDRRTAIKTACIAGAMLTGTSASGVAVADDGDGDGTGPDAPGQVAWIANSGNATVSKVNLTEREEVARYRTEDPDLPPDPSSWRTNRLITDPDGHAWVLNTGVDQDNPDTELQGSLARISVTSVDDEEETSSGPDDLLNFERSDDGDIETKDDRVEVYQIGDVGDNPRALELVDGYLWVAFQDGQYALKLDPTALEEGEGPYRDPDDSDAVVASVDHDEFSAYNMVDGGDGTLWVVSRDSFTTVQTNNDVFHIDTEGNEAGDGVGFRTNPYTVYADQHGDIWITDGSAFGQVTDRRLGRIRDGDPDDLIQYDLAETTGFHRVATEVDETLWVTADGPGEGILFAIDLADLPEDEDDPLAEVARVELPGNGPPVGADPQVGDDERLWVIARNGGVTDRNDGVIYPFDYDEEAFADPVGVGEAPYVYRDFFAEVESSSIVGVKFRDIDASGDPEDQPTLEDWTITLFDEDPREDDIEPIATTVTGEDGDYEFDDLTPGMYYVAEELQDGWVQTFPDPDEDDGIHVISLGGAEEVEANFGNVREDPGDPRTIGFWRNWSGDCTSGNQENVLGETLEKADDAGRTVTLGELVLTKDETCPEAVNVLRKRDIDSGIRANDGAYDLAAQLLAAKLNVEGAPEDAEEGPRPEGVATGELASDECEELDADTVDEVIENGQALLEDIEFDGTGSYLEPQRGPPAARDDDTQAQREEALAHAECLDKFNNGELAFQQTDD